MKCDKDGCSKNAKWKIRKRISPLEALLFGGWDWNYFCSLNHLINNYSLDRMFSWSGWILEELIFKRG